MNVKELLEESLAAFNFIPNSKYIGKYRNTYDLAAKISEYLKKDEVSDPFSSKMFTQLKIKYEE